MSCPIPECLSVVGPGHVLCRKHWALVPRPIQDTIQHYARTRRSGPSHKRACTHAIRTVMAAVAKRPVLRTPASLPYRDD